MIKLTVPVIGNSYNIQINSVYSQKIKKIIRFCVQSIIWR